MLMIFSKIGLLEQNKQAESISQYEANDKSLAQEIRETSQKVKIISDIFCDDFSFIFSRTGKIDIILKQKLKT